MYGFLTREKLVRTVYLDFFSSMETGSCFWKSSPIGGKVGGNKRRRMVDHFFIFYIWGGGFRVNNGRMLPRNWEHPIERKTRSGVEGERRFFLPPMSFS